MQPGLADDCIVTACSSSLTGTFSSSLMGSCSSNLTGSCSGTLASRCRSSSEITLQQQQQQPYLPSSRVWNNSEPSADALTTMSSWVQTARQTTASLCPYSTCRGLSLTTRLTAPFCFGLLILEGGTASQMTKVVSLLPDTMVLESVPAAIQVTMSLCWRRLCSRRPSSVV